MRVSHRHRDSRVTKQFLDYFERCATHRKVTCEGMPKHMPPDGAQPCASACVRQRILELAVSEHVAGHAAEHQRPTKMTMFLESGTNLVAKRDLAWLS